MLCAIWYHLNSLKNGKKHPWRSVNPSVKSRAYGTKSCRALYMVRGFYIMPKWASYLLTWNKSDTFFKFATLSLTYFRPTFLFYTP